MKLIKILRTFYFWKESMNLLNGLVLMACLAMGQVSQSSTGANSPNIANVQGDVNIPPKVDVVKVTDKEIETIKADAKAIQAIIKELQDRYQAEMKESTMHFIEESEAIMAPKCKLAGLPRDKCQINIKTRVVEPREEEKKP